MENLNNDPSCSFFTIESTIYVTQFQNFESLHSYLSHIVTFLPLLWRHSLFYLECFHLATYPTCYYIWHYKRCDTYPSLANMSHFVDSLKRDVFVGIFPYYMQLRVIINFKSFSFYTTAAKPIRRVLCSTCMYQYRVYLFLCSLVTT